MQRHRKNKKINYQEGESNGSQRSSQRSRTRDKVSKRQGRPIRQKEELSVEESNQENPIKNTRQVQLWEEICEVNIKFGYDIGEDKGFVYSEQERSKFKLHDMSKDLRWNEKDQWNSQSEKTKIKHVFDQKIKMLLSQKKRNTFQLLFLDSSRCMAEEFTLDFYNVLAEIFIIINLEQQENTFQSLDQFKQHKLRTLALNICNNSQQQYPYLCLKFKNPRKANRKKNQNKPIERLEAYRNWIFGLEKNLRKCGERLESY